MDTSWVAGVSGVTGGGLGAIITSLFNRRKIGAEADVSVGSAWQQLHVATLAEVEALKRNNSELRGEVRALSSEVAKIQRQEQESRYWQGRVLEREAVLRSTLESLLSDRGLPWPHLPDPPAARTPNTRVEDRREQPRG